MRRFYLNQDGKPCIWPIPGDCLWTSERFETNGSLTITADGEFAFEAGLFADALNQAGRINASIAGTEVGLTLRKCCEPDLGSEGYMLTADDTGIYLKASTRHGAFNGLQTLHQLINNTFDTSICGFRITDSPSMPFRGVRIPLPDGEGLPWFCRFVELLAKYKINKLILDIGDTIAFADALLSDDNYRSKAAELTAYASSHHIDIIPCISLAEAGRVERAVQEIIGIFGAKTVSVTFAGKAPDTTGKTTAQTLAHDVIRIHGLLSLQGAGLALSSEMLHPSTGSRRLCYNAATGRNDVIASTCEAVDLIPKDILILDVNHGGYMEDTESEAYFTSRGFKTVFASCEGPLKNWEHKAADAGVQGAFVTIGQACNAALGAGGNLLAAILRVALLTWWAGYRADYTVRGALLPLHLEKEIAGLYPMERDWLERNCYPSAENLGYYSIDLRSQYNSPLMHSYWRADDHFMMHLQEAMPLPNSVPFSLFQGVLDFRFDNAFVMAGGSWNNGILGIQVGCMARSVSFLHAYIFGKQQVIAGRGTVPGKHVGHYEVKYADGMAEKAEIVYGRDICFWKNYHGANEGAYAANPVLMGVSEEGLHYTIFAMEWVNPRPDVKIVSIDVMPSDQMDGRIALFGITAVK